MPDELPPDPLPGIADRGDRLALAGLDARAEALAAGATEDEAWAAAREAKGWAQFDDARGRVLADIARRRALLNHDSSQPPDPAATTERDGETSS